MKRLLASLLIVLQVVVLCPPARAAYPTQDLPSQVGYQSSRVVKAKRIMVVTPERWGDLSLNTFIDAAVEYNGVYQVLDMAREQGAAVHFYNSKIFENYQYGTKLWREAGDHYALAIVLQPGGGQVADVRYVSPDSTNIQVLAVGGMRSNGNPHWSADTAIAGYVDGVRSGRLEVLGSSRGGFVLPWTPTGLSSDTIWANNLATGIRIQDATLAAMTNVVSVVRVTHPGKMGTETASWGNGGPDSATARMPGASWAAPMVPGTADSVALAGEYLGPIWKVKYTSGRETWFYKFVSTGTANVHTPALLWACVARFVDVKPIKWAMDFDDVTNILDSANYPRWRNSAAESSLTALRAVGVVPTNGIDPTNVPGYIGGFTPRGETQPYAAGSDSVPWGGAPAHTYLKKLNWNHHSHDSTNGSISSNLVGGYGGYAPSNGGNGVANAQTGRRYASRYNPGDNEASNNMGAGGNFGIVQRLAYSDSVLRVWAPLAGRPPYLTFPANEMLPVNWKARAAVAGYTPTRLFAIETATCPIDSVLWAFDYGLNGNKSSGKGDVFLRSGSLGGGMKKEALWADRDSFVALMICMYPRERWTTRVGSRLVQATIINSFLQGIGGREAYLADVNYRAGALLGLNNRAQMAQMNRPNYSESYDSDVNKIMNSGTGLVNFPARQSTRIVYQHPGQQTTHPTGNGDAHIDIFLRGIHSTIRALDKIAGRPVTRCVPAWQVYSR